MRLLDSVLNTLLVMTRLPFVLLLIALISIGMIIEVAVAQSYTTSHKFDPTGSQEVIAGVLTNDKMVGSIIKGSKGTIMRSYTGYTSDSVKTLLKTGVGAANSEADATAVGLKTNKSTIKDQVAHAAGSAAWT